MGNRETAGSIERLNVAGIFDFRVMADTDATQKPYEEIEEKATSGETVMSHSKTVGTIEGLKPIASAQEFEEFQAFIKANRNTPYDIFIQYADFSISQGKGKIAITEGRKNMDNTFTCKAIPRTVWTPSG